MLARRVPLAILAVLALALPAGEALAQAKKKRKAPAAKKTAPARPNPQADAKAVSELMGPFKWGMSKDEIVGILAKQIDERIQEQIAATTDIYTQDRLRKRGAEEKKRLAASFVEFDGKKTGWDVSIVDKEFGHRNDEAMLVYWEHDARTNRNQRRFFFFVDDRLWKMFIAFDASMFQDRTFDDFRQIMENRYGKGAPEREGGVSFLWWRAPGYYLRAIDLTQFYGNFCIAISDSRVEETIVARREQRNPQVKQTNRVVDSITMDPDKKPDLADPNQNVIDRITGGR